MTWLTGTFSNLHLLNQRFSACVPWIWTQQVLFQHMIFKQTLSEAWELAVDGGRILWQGDRELWQFCLSPEFALIKEEQEGSMVRKEGETLRSARGGMVLAFTGFYVPWKGISIFSRWWKLLRALEWERAVCCCVKICLWKAKTKAVRLLRSVVVLVRNGSR